MMYEVKDVTSLGKEKLELALKHLYEPITVMIPKELKELTEFQWMVLHQILEDLLQEAEDSTIH